MNYDNGEGGGSLWEGSGDASRELEVYATLIYANARCARWFDEGFFFLGRVTDEG